MIPDDRFWSKVDASGDCWEWTAGKIGNGYGATYMSGNKRQTLAHRWAWENLVGPIPPGMQLDHLCRNRACVNPDHLEVVTGRVNGLRSYSPMAQMARRTTCKAGLHPLTYDGPNKEGTRRCYPCALRRWRDNKRAKAAAGRKAA